MKDFTGRRIYSMSSCVSPYNGLIVEKTLKKCFPNNDESTLYEVKVEGIDNHMELYEDEMKI